MCSLRLLTAQNNGAYLSKKATREQHYFAELEKFKQSGRKAYSGEEAREKAGICPNVMNTLEINQCLQKEVQITMENYRAYTSALRAVEVLASPYERASGDISGTASVTSLAKAFDKAESAWHHYYKSQCSAAYEAYRDGTIALSMELTCRLQLIRDRMHELEAIYQFMH